MWGYPNAEALEADNVRSIPNMWGYRGGVKKLHDISGSIPNMWGYPKVSNQN